MSFYNYPQVVPHLVEDVNLKRARVETEEGDAIRVTGINCGDKVTIVPTITEGTKIADYTINNVDGELYAPEAPTPPVTEVSITPSVTTGTKIADFSVNEVAGELYAPPGGVGEAYTGSTGGEIFNYYGTDSNANTAEGNYSTTVGYNNKNTAPYVFICGSNNQTQGTNTNSKGGLIAGYNNSVEGIADASICLGGNNNIYGNNEIFIGYDNTSKNSISPKSICIGRGLSVDSQNLRQKVVLGTFNAQTASLSSENGKLQTIIGGGDSLYSGHRHNAMEVYTGINGTYSCCAIFPEDFALSNYTTTNKAYVNAITPPQDPSNMTADDKTLVTKSHLTTNLGDYTKSQVAYLEDWDTASALPLDNTTVSLPTTYGTIPAWAKRAILTFRWENELITKELFFDKDEGIHLYVVQRAYSTFPETIHYRHLRIEWDFTNQTLLVKDYWTYDQDMSNAGAISNWDYTLTNAPTCKILSVIYSE